MFRLMEKARKNNKGFSLVELIVVVLIIAIIAVALAPQVVKYVGKAKTNVEDNNAATIKSAVQAAVAEYEGDHGKIADNVTISFTVKKDAVASKDSVETKLDKFTPADNYSALKTLVAENIGGDKLDNNYSVTISKEQVTVKPEKKA